MGDNRLTQLSSGIPSGNRSDIRVRIVRNRDQQRLSRPGGLAAALSQPCKVRVETPSTPAKVDCPYPIAHLLRRRCRRFDRSDHCRCLRGPAKVAAPRPLRGLPGVALLARMIQPMAMPRQITSESSGWRWPAITMTRRDRVSEASVIWCIAGVLKVIPRIIHRNTWSPTCHDCANEFACKTD